MLPEMEKKAHREKHPHHPLHPLHPELNHAPIVQSSLDKRFGTPVYTLKSSPRKEYDLVIPLVLENALSKEEYRRHIEKINEMMNYHPSQLHGRAGLAHTWKERWMRISVLLDFFLFVAVLTMVLTVIAFGVCLGLAIGDVGYESWWWIVVVLGAVALACLIVVTLLALAAIYTHRKWRKCVVIVKDEATLQKYHEVAEYIEKENKRYFLKKGIAFRLNLRELHPKTFHRGWQKIHVPTIEVFRVGHGTQFAPTAAVSESILRSDIDTHGVPTTHRHTTIQASNAPALNAVMRHNAKEGLVPEALGTSSSQRRFGLF